MQAGWQIRAGAHICAQKHEQVFTKNILNYCWISPKTDRRIVAEVTIEMFHENTFTGSIRFVCQADGRTDGATLIGAPQGSETPEKKHVYDEWLMMYLQCQCTAEVKKRKRFSRTSSWSIVIPRGKFPSWYNWNYMEARKQVFRRASTTVNLPNRFNWPFSAN
jgi:hypothetical protein